LPVAATAMADLICKKDCTVCKFEDEAMGTDLSHIIKAFGDLFELDKLSYQLWELLERILMHTECTIDNLVKFSRTDVKGLLQLGATHHSVWIKLLHLLNQERLENLAIIVRSVDATCNEHTLKVLGSCLRSLDGSDIAFHGLAQHLIYGLSGQCSQTACSEVRND
jgi:hypothetical protein